MLHVQVSTEFGSVSSAIDEWAFTEWEALAVELVEVEGLAIDEARKRALVELGFLLNYASSRDGLLVPVVELQ